MARIEGGALDLRCEPVDAAEAADAAVDRLHRHSPDREVRCTATGAVEVLADWDRLAQVLDNLLANADRHAPVGSALDIDLAAEGSEVVIGVTDRGPGVSSQLRDRVFDRFVRGEDGAPGTGLGLAIVRALVEAQGGRVWLEDPPGGGARFVLSLPVA
jgi:signal transduction histidine kinase